MIFSRRGLFLALLLPLMGCVSTGDRFERAEKAESAGLHLEAANYYARTVESDGSHAEARAGLIRAGSAAVTSSMTEVDQLEASGSFAQIADLMSRLAELVDRAGTLDVSLTLPSDFGERRAFYVGAAVDQLLRESETLAERGDLEGARKTLEKARNDYSPDAQREEEVDHRLADVLLSLAGLDMEDQRFRSAFDTASRAIDILDGYNDKAESEARLVATSALAQGVRSLAMTPFWESDQWQRAAPPDLRTDINDAVSFGDSGRFSPFIAVQDPGQTRRAVRDLRVDRRILRRGEMLDVASELDADFLLAGELATFSREDKVRRTRTRDAKTRGRGGVDTTYVEEQIDIRFRAELTFRVIDRRTRRMVLEQTLRTDASKRVDRAKYAGNWDNLDLSGGQRRLFEREEWRRQERDIMVELSDRLAAELVRRLDDSLLRLID